MQTLADQIAPITGRVQARSPATDPRTPQGQRWLRAAFERIRRNVNDAASKPGYDVLESVISGELKPVEERTTSQTYWEHILLRCIGDVALDIQRNYSESLRLASCGSAELIANGHEGIALSARRLDDLLATTDYVIVDTVIRDTGATGGWVTERWGYRDERIKGNQIVDGIDTFLIRNGRIEVKMINYTVEPVQPSQEFQSRIGVSA
ncbi:MAG TPA: hypothetical protein VF169_04815 [Albitalea sp.]|uniref:hypothetical protein n=1 Tax=Piscinibacter sp. TaxID=1903157 RepID=UPI002ED67FCC